MIAATKVDLMSMPLKQRIPLIDGIIKVVEKAYTVKRYLAFEY
jgi:hypothetical protein